MNFAAERRVFDSHQLPDCCGVSECHCKPRASLSDAAGTRPSSHALIIQSVSCTIGEALSLRDESVVPSTHVGVSPILLMLWYPKLH